MCSVHFHFSGFESSVDTKQSVVLKNVCYVTGFGWTVSVAHENKGVTEIHMYTHRPIQPFLIAYQSITTFTSHYTPLHTLTQTNSLKTTFLSILIVPFPNPTCSCTTFLHYSYYLHQRSFDLHRCQFEGCMNLISILLGTIELISTATLILNRKCGYLVFLQLQLLKLLGLH